ncbi:MAG: helix-turn-helix domain-containing protein [Streptosporangiales bacterium]|nr:helix-turn-helix domain-containing protein [Streptosporangiales bacterium]
MTRFEAANRLSRTESAVEQAARLLAGAAGRVPDARLREAAWVARCVGRGEVVQVLRSGDVDGDIALLLGKPLAYTARAAHPTTCLYLDRVAFDRLLETRPAIARRWLSSVAGRLAHSQARILGLLGRSLTAQTAQLLLDEAVDGQVTFPQRTLAAMLGAQRPSLNKVLKALEADDLIRIRYAAIEILNPATLTRRAER